MNEDPTEESLMLVRSLLAPRWYGCCDCWQRDDQHAEDCSWMLTEPTRYRRAVEDLARVLDKAKTGDDSDAQ